MKLETHTEYKTAPIKQARLTIAEMAKQHADRLLRAAMMLSGSEAEAQDLVQETFCRALSKIAQFRGDASAYTWLYVIMRRLYFRQYRRQRLTSLLFTFHDTAVQTNPEERYDMSARSQLLRHALLRMPPKHREIIILRYIEDLQLTQIATMLGVAPGTVKSRLHHANCNLRRELCTHVEGLKLQPGGDRQ